MSRLVSFLVLVAILILIGIVFFQVMAGFFVPLFLAALLGVVVQPLYRWLLEKCRGYRYVASTATTLLVLLAVLLPIGLVITTATMEGLSLLDQLRLGNVQSRLDELRGQLGLTIPREGDLRSIEARLKRWYDQQRQGVTPDASPEAVDNLLDRLTALETWVNESDGIRPKANAEPLRLALTRFRDAPPESLQRDNALITADAEFREFKRNLLGGTYQAFITELANPTDEQLEQVRRATLSTAGSVVTFGNHTVVILGKIAFGIVIMVVTLFFLLAEGSRMLDAIVRVSPLEEQYVRELVSEFDRACRAIVSATLLSAIAQGLLAGVGFYFAGLTSSVALLMLLTMVLALIPFVGAVSVWLTVALYLYFFQGDLWAAVGLSIYGSLIISQADNVIKPYVLHGQSNLHPLLALLSVLGGVQALGPIGILVGPMVVVFLQVLLRLVQREMSSLDRSEWFRWPPLGSFAGASAGAASREADHQPPSSTEPESSPPVAASTERQQPAAGTRAPVANSPKPNSSGKKRRK
jgi:predicted PurR-regulated permease PerM